MKRIAFYLLISFSVLTMACGGGKTDEEKQEEEAIDVQKNPLGAIKKMGENMKEQAEKAEERRKKAAASGEKVEAIHYEKLMEYLPNEINGYERQEPDGGTVEMQDLSYSSANVEYKNEDGNKIKVSLIDYNVAGQLYQMATAMWATGMKIDSPNEKAMGVSVSDNIKGWQSYKKKKRKASVVLGIGERFLLSVEADDQNDVSKVMSIAKSMGLDELAEM